MESILIIGDDMALCSLLRDYLARHNMEVATSHDGLSGYDPARPGRFDRILVDVKLSGAEDGLAHGGLVARIRSILLPNQPVPGLAVRRLSVYGFEIDTATRSAHYRGTLLALTDTEFALLEAFLQAPGVLLGRRHLAECVLQRPFHTRHRGLDMLVSRLRRKLEIEDNPGAAIRTIRSSGYVFAIPHQHSLPQEAPEAGAHRSIGSPSN